MSALERPDIMTQHAVSSSERPDRAAEAGQDGPAGSIIGMHSFGASGQLPDVLAKFGFVPDKIVAAAENQIARTKNNSIGQDR